MRTLSVLSIALLSAGCSGSMAPSHGLVFGEGGEQNAAIFYGDEADRPEHEAVVALLERDGSTVYPDPFCTATLVGHRKVVTAAHCTEGLQADDVVIYLGTEVKADPHYLDSIYTVARLSIHPHYDSYALENDISVLELGNAPLETTARVAPLPPSLALTDADIGGTVDIAGYGYQEDDSYGEKLHVEVPIAGFGCGSVDGCSDLPDRPETQVAYLQPGEPENGGPCNGDSGGPMFIERGGTVFLAGVTSYGDYDCTTFGVSTRVDAYAEYLADPFAPPAEDPDQPGDEPGDEPTDDYPDYFGEDMGLVINEVMVNPVGNDGAAEWVEIVSIDTNPIDLSGWTLHEEGGRTIELPAQTLQPGEALVFEARLYLNNDGDSLELIGDLPGDYVVWDSAEEGVSLTREIDLNWETDLVPHDTLDDAVGTSSPGTRFDGTAFLE